MARDTICSGAKLTAIADAIRLRAGTDSPLTLDAMAAAVAAIPSGGGGAEAVAALVGRTATEVPFADSVTAVGDYAFYRCASLAGEVVLPHALYIGSSAFDRCAGVTAIVAPECVTVKSFGNVEGLTRLELPAATTVQGFTANALRELRLPSCVDFRATFSSASAIERLSLPAATAFSCDMSNQVPLNGARSLRALALDGAPRIGDHFSNTLLVQGCPALESLYLPALAELGASAIKGCKSLTSLWLPSCVGIHHQAIGAGTPLETLVLPAAAVCALSGPLNADTAIARGTGHVYVPGALLAGYAQAEHWSAYASQLRAIEDWPDEVAAARATAEAAALGWD